jgi:molybdate-binding protein/DNA-binding transcriptional ArsR family regulator
MSSIERLRDFEQIKLLADPRRLKVLRQLMTAPASLTQVGKAIGEHPAWVRHHLKLLEQAGLVEMVESRVTSGVVENFYLARAGGLLLQELILPETTGRPAVVFSGSHDLAVELLASKLSNYLDVLTLPVGSLDGLMTLRQGLCHISGAHLLDQNGEYNIPFVQHIFPDRPMRIITLAHREQGLMTAPGNPKGIRSLADLARADVSFINRNPGSGTRLWLDQQLQTLGIPAKAIRGYQATVSTHTKSAWAVFSGEADAAVGLRAAAHPLGLDFIPLFHERYDLIFAQEQAELLDPLLEALQSSAIRRGIEGLTGYETLHSGEQIPL